MENDSQTPQQPAQNQGAMPPVQPRPWLRVDNQPATTPQSNATAIQSSSQQEVVEPELTSNEQVITPEQIAFVPPTQFSNDAPVQQEPTVASIDAVPTVEANVVPTQVEPFSVVTENIQPIQVTPEGVPQSEQQVQPHETRQDVATDVVSEPVTPPETSVEASTTIPLPGSTTPEIAPIATTVPPSAAQPVVADHHNMFAKPEQAGSGKRAFLASRKSKVIAAASAGVTLLVVGGLLTMLGADPSPQQKFEAALERRLETSYIGQDFLITVGDQFRVSVGSQSDFSDPSNPKTQGNAVITSGGDELTTEVDMNFICARSCYVRYNQVKIEKRDLTKKLSGSWYKISDSAPTFDSTLVDYQAINSVLGEVITGNITGDAHDHVADAIGDGKLYTISEPTSGTTDRKSVLKFTVKTDKNTLAAANNKVADQYGLDASDVEDLLTAADSINFYDPMSEQIIRTEMQLGEGIKGIVLYRDFDKKVTIKEPSSSKPSSEANKLLQ